MERCTFVKGQGPRCCLEAGHKGSHLYRCAGSFCPGYQTPASQAGHPWECVIGPRLVRTQPAQGEG